MNSDSVILFGIKSYINVCALGLSLGRALEGNLVERAIIDSMQRCHTLRLEIHGKLFAQRECEMKSVRPPSTVITWPVMKLDSSEARKSTAFAISSG